MANLKGAFSATILDDSKKKKAVNLYQILPDTTTLASLVTLAQAFGSVLDPVTDGKIDRLRLIFEVPLLGGWKASPVSGSNDEETGLITFPLDTPADKSYGFDIPAFPDSLTVSTDHNLIDTAATAVANFISFVTGSTANVNDLWSSSFNTPVRSAIVTFRKLRRQLARRRRA